MRLYSSNPRILHFMSLPRQLRAHTTFGLACLVVLALVAGCATTGVPGGRSERRAVDLAASGEHGRAAALYRDLAADATGPARDRLILLAVGEWLDAGDGQRAASALSTVAQPAGGDLLTLWSADTAALSLWEGKPDAALQRLEPLRGQALPSADRLRIEALYADAWFQKDQPARAVQLYIQRETWLNDGQSIESNRKRLWAGLLVSDMRTLHAAAEAASDPVVRGWLTLGALATSTGRHGIGWYNGVVRWQDEHRGHPANDVLADLELPEGGLLKFPRQIALLLPLSGANASAGNAVQNGFLGAYFAATANLFSATADVSSATADSFSATADGFSATANGFSATANGFSAAANGFSAAADLNNEQSIKVYDVVSLGGARQAYTRAVSEGAEFVVGPLIRSSVEELAGAAPLPVPVLTLNYLPDDDTAPPGLYQYALSPEDEANSAALRAIADGYRRAVALVPANDWGRRMLKSFASRFETAGGTVLDYRTYPPSKQDFSSEIEDLLSLNLSVQRYRRLRANIDRPLQFDPRRRQDAEFVFLAADANSGRLLKSQLKFHYAGDLPVYSTSFIYSMDGRSDSDLNGVMFADTPWIVSPQAWFAELPALYNKFWPDHKNLGRLQAMGYDAYHLVAELFNVRTEPMREFAGATGRLYLSADGRVHRRLAWAQFVDGKPVPMRAEAYRNSDQGNSDQRNSRLRETADDEALQ